jgi:hypothetical protein
MDGWTGAFTAAIDAGDVRQALDVLSTRATDHAGTPTTADKRLAHRALFAALPDAEDRFVLAHRLLEHPEPVAAELALTLLPGCFAAHPDAAARLLHDLCGHANWEVREYAADAVGALLNTHWDGAYTLCTAWRAEPSENLRRAVVVGIKYAARDRVPERGDPLLDLIDPLLTDRRPYVRRNLGPFTLGSGLLRAYPAQTLDRLRAWSEREDAATRWNVAMACSAAEARRHTGSARALLDTLAADPRPFVQGAVRAARRRLAL